MTKRTTSLFAAVCVILTSAAAVAQGLVIDVVRAGAEKIPVSINVTGDSAFSKSLRRNLELSGYFTVKGEGAVSVSGIVGSAIKAEGRGKALTLPSLAADSKSARMEARKLADRMIEVYANGKGFAQEPIVFVSREGTGAEIYTCYPDGYDIRRLTADGKSAVGPRWKNADTLFYTGFLGGGPQVFELDTRTGRKKLKWSFRGLTTGAAASPDSRTAAIILSVHGNPELYTIDLGSGAWARLTHTLNASEGQPCWSPDGSQIVYVTDESRFPQLYMINPATRQKRRLTYKGSQNVDPDWGADGRIAYITKRGGSSQVAVMDPRSGEASVILVTESGNWEHPSWSSDGRHIVASRDNALFIIDTLPEEEGGEKPKQLFMNPGRWITPSWRRSR